MSKRKSLIPCQHERAGIVTNQPGAFDFNRHYCAVSVCGDPTCRALSIAYVKNATGEPGIYISDSPREDQS